MKVRDLLTKKPSGVITISPDQTLRAASKVLAQHNIGALVAVDTAELPIGILSERDIVRAIAATGAKALTRTVDAVMTKDLITAVPEDDVTSLIGTMTDRHIRHLPIRHDQKLVGMGRSYKWGEHLKKALSQGSSARTSTRLRGKFVRQRLKMAPSPKF